MQNDFDAWNIKKKKLDKDRRDLLFKEGEIWWCAVGKNIGEEVYGKGREFRRPVVVLKKLSHNSCIAIPTTTKPREGSWYHHLNVAHKDRWVMMNQIRFISANRLWVRESSLSVDEFRKLKKSVAGLLGL
jgi:mRNA interferase MazF